MSASDVAWSSDNQTPKEMDRADMDQVRDQFVAAAEMADRAGFDMIELHAAHGYLLSSFITPLTNRPHDDYGGSLENRLRYPLEVFRAMRAVWPDDKPMSVRISANDWVGDDGVTPEEAVEIAKRSPTPAPTSSTCLPARPRRRPSRSTAACSRPRSPTASATRRAWRPWPWATSTRPITSIRS
jgi:2,4-dienoyl-CoA reductase-like NADH-dependent reductase (Old Yellow Enzyme family)